MVRSSRKNYSSSKKTTKKNYRKKRSNKRGGAKNENVSNSNLASNISQLNLGNKPNSFEKYPYTFRISTKSN